MARHSSRMDPTNRMLGALSLWLIPLGLMVLSATSRASEESVDQATQTALALDINLKDGRRLYQVQCVACHGMTAAGDPSRSIPALAGQRFAYLVRQLANFSGEERENPSMHRVTARRDVRAAQSWANLAGYLSRLRRDRAAETGDGTHLALGRGIFHEQCASCHEQDAGGDKDGLVPALAGQHYSYLVGQMRQLAADRRHNVDEDLQRFLRSFETPEIEGVADYLSRQHAAGETHRVMRADGTVIN